MGLDVFSEWSKARCLCLRMLLSIGSGSEHVLHLIYTLDFWDLLVRDVIIC